MSHAEQGRPNPLVVPWTPYVPSYTRRSRPITAAAILSLVLGTLGLVTGSVMLVLDLAGSHALGGGVPPDLQQVLDLGVALGFGTALVIFVGSVMHLVGWYWLWGRLKTGGVLGAINGINDIIFPAGGGLWLALYVLPSLGMSINENQWLVVTLAAIGLVGVVMLALLAMGWDNLKE